MAKEKTTPATTSDDWDTGNDGFAEIETKIHDLPWEPGAIFAGTLGPVQASKNPQMPDYRTLSIDNVDYFLPSHADLRCLMKYPDGTAVKIKFEGGDGKKGSPYRW